MILVLSMVRKHPFMQSEACTWTAALWGIEKPTLGVNARQASPRPLLLIAFIYLCYGKSKVGYQTR